MIISASRRTDIPCFHADWLMDVIQAGQIQVRNPFNAAQVRWISLSPEAVDGFVFWTKDPQNLMPHLGELDRMGYSYYFQFTLTPYGQDIEPGLRPKSEIIKTFESLAYQIGARRVIWRYDPILLRGEIDIPWHLSAFRRAADALHQSTEKVIISFIDMYPRIAGRGFRELSVDEMQVLSEGICAAAGERGLTVCGCCEPALNLKKAACVDAALLSAPFVRDPNQREGCGCAKSVDIGNYGTCKNGCLYCYACR